MDSTKTYTATETSTILGVPKSTMLRAVRENRAPHLHAIRVGQTIRFPRNVIDRLAEPEVA